MNLEEARAWLRGERSMCNSITEGDASSRIAITAISDAAMTQQAYWVVKAYYEFAGYMKP